MDGWLRIRDASKYASVSERTLREWLRQGLKHSKIRGLILLKPSWIDEFIEGFAGSSNKADEIANSCLKNLRA